MSQLQLRVSRYTVQLRNLHYHHRKKIYWSNFPGWWWIQKPYKTRKIISTTEIFHLWPPYFSAKKFQHWSRVRFLFPSIGKRAEQCFESTVSEGRENSSGRAKQVPFVKLAFKNNPSRPYSIAGENLRSELFFRGYPIAPDSQDQIAPIAGVFSLMQFRSRSKCLDLQCFAMSIAFIPSSKVDLKPTPVLDISGQMTGLRFRSRIGSQQKTNPRSIAYPFAENWGTGGILFREYCFGEENSLSSAANSVSSARNSVSSRLHTNNRPKGTH